MFKCFQILFKQFPFIFKPFLTVFVYWITEYLISHIFWVDLLPNILFLKKICFININIHIKLLLFNFKHIMTYL